ncbi:MAG: plasmid pRiA4b ORF-3 family protein [Fluviicola sp.]|jgi:hypothetical protein|nr:plasmid pRiA4b ORF-3 family protein [Fluviicola sp.]
MPGLKFRVLLDSEQKNEVFRDILIKDTENFETFYKAIISSFRFQGDQMASFYVSNDDWDKGHEISLMDMSYEDDSIDAVPSVMKDAVIKDFITEPDQKFILVYDFMRMWIFLAELIGYEKEGPETPEVTLSMGMAPPEDSREATVSEDDDFGGEYTDDEDEDDLGFDDYEDGYNEEDMGGYDDYDY